MAVSSGIQVHLENAEFEISPGRKVGYGHPCYIIAEIGQNHQGSVEIAKQLIKGAAEAGVDCVKFQKSYLDERFNARCLRRPYDVPQSWGKTYGEHKVHLEFSEDDYLELQKYSASLGVDFSASAIDRKALEFLDKINVPFFKVASCDVGDLDYIEFMAKKMKPMVISSGMQDLNTMRRIYHTVSKYHTNFCFLQCTSSYPVKPEYVNLNVIKTYQETFCNIPIGYSGHESGTTISLGAIAMGAKVLERHITLDKSWKGSDHKASLNMEELADLVQQIRLLESAFGTPKKILQQAEKNVIKRMGKSAVAVGNLKKGDVLTEDNMKIKHAEPYGFPSHMFSALVGSTLLNNVDDDETIKEEDVQLLDRTVDEKGNKKKFVCLILARGGSKRVPGKNIKELHGHPLVAWSILAARKAGCFDEIWVSTDSEKIGRIAESYGALYHDRDPAAADDTSTNRDGYYEFLKHHKDVYAVASLQCTFAQQKPDMLIEGARKIREDHCDCVFGAGLSLKFRWTTMNPEKDDDWTRPINCVPHRKPRSQDWEGDVVETGAFYMFKVDQFLATGDYQSGRVSYLLDRDTDDYVDIDTPGDFARAEILIQKHDEKFNLQELCSSKGDEITKA